MGRHSRPAVGFGVLFVCTGNVCRSPFAEILTRHLLVERLGERGASVFTVASAGVHAAVGAPLHRRTRRELAPWGLEGAAAAGFRGRQLRGAMIGEADLVLGIDVRHRSAVIEHEHRALWTGFGLREFARLAAAVDPAVLPGDPVPRAHALVEEARRRRGVGLPTPPEEDRVPDPVSGTQEAHRTAAALIARAVATVVDIVAPPPHQPGPPPQPLPG